MFFGAYLEFLMEKRRLSKKELARIVKISLEYLGFVLEGRIIPAKSTAIRVVSVLEPSSEDRASYWRFFGEDDGAFSVPVEEKKLKVEHPPALPKKLKTKSMPRPLPLPSPVTPEPKNIDEDKGGSGELEEMREISKDDFLSILGLMNRSMVEIQRTPLGRRKSPGGNGTSAGNRDSNGKGGLADQKLVFRPRKKITSYSKEISVSFDGRSVEAIICRAVELRDNEPTVHRSVMCLAYSACLTFAAKRMWEGFSCCDCPHFHDPSMKEDADAMKGGEGFLVY